MIYTVFPKDEDNHFLPTDFATYKEALEYSEYLRTHNGVDSDIESTSGEVV